MPPKHILIFTEPVPRGSPLIDWLGECWVRMGFRVSFVSDPDSDEAADIAFLHIDLTHTPAHFATLADRYPVVINGSSTNISKELFSEQLLNRNSTYAGKVIVKTRANYGGLPELRGTKISIFKPGKVSRLIRKAVLSGSTKNRLVNHFLWKYVSVLDPDNYPVFDSINVVPSGVWSNSKLIVEKFLPERDAEGRYVLRHWYFFGNKEFSRTLRSGEQLPKWGNMTEHERADSRKEWSTIQTVNETSIPKEVRHVRTKLKMDYGRIDWVMNNGRPVVFDANKTPNIGVRSVDPQADHSREQIICQFSEGLNYYLDLDNIL